MLLRELVQKQYSSVKCVSDFRAVFSAWMSGCSDTTQLWLSLRCSGAENIAKNRSEIVLGATVDSLS